MTLPPEVEQKIEEATLNNDGMASDEEIGNACREMADWLMERVCAECGEGLNKLDHDTWCSEIKLITRAEYLSRRERKP